jgi:hypothetical protein
VIYRAAQRVGDRRGLPPDWLNDGVKGFLPGPDPGATVLFDRPGLAVRIASPRYLFAMKVLAARVERAAQGGGRSASMSTTSPTPRWARRSRTASTTWAPTRGSSRSGPTPTPRRSPWRPSGGGGTRWARSPTPRRAGCSSPPTPGIQRVPQPAVEAGAWIPGRAYRAGGHRLPPPAWHQQVEPHRAPPVQPHLHELARPAAGQPRGRGAAHRDDHHPHGPEGPGRTRPGLLPTGIKVTDTELAAAAHRPCLPRRVELHDHPFTIEPSSQPCNTCTRP